MKNFKDLIYELLISHKALEYNMSLNHNLDFFPENQGAMSNEQGERFHQNISLMETRYQRKWGPEILADN